MLLEHCGVYVSIGSSEVVLGLEEDVEVAGSWGGREMT